MSEEKKTNNLDSMNIPNFVEDKDTTESTSIDMSIFKMTDEELYDDVPKKVSVSNNNNTTINFTKKKSNSTLTLCLVLCGILLVTTVVSAVYALKQHSKVSELESSLNQYQAQINDYNTLISTKDSQINDLNSKIEELSKAGTTTDPDNKYPKGTELYVTEDGNSMAITNTANSEDRSAKTLYWGDKVTLVEDATKDSNGNYWGKIDDGYIRIEYNGEVWASTEKQ